MVNIAEFTKFGRDWKEGKYSLLNPKSYEYVELWKEEFNRCREGYSYGGYYMTGRQYFYHNFCSIEQLNRSTGRKEVGRPTLRDVDWYIFGNLQRAIDEKKNFYLLTGRRGGKSYIGSANVVYDPIFYDSGKTMICAYDSTKGNDCYLKAQVHIDGLKETELYRHVLKRNLDVLQFGYKEKDPNTNTWIEKGSDRFIYNVNFGNKPTAAVGKSVSFAYFEEIGVFNNLIEAFGATSPCWRDGSLVIGTAFLAGTGGDMKGGGTMDAYRMFEDPETYNLITFYDDQEFKQHYYIPNLDCNLNRTKDRPCAGFIPAHYLFTDFKDVKTGVTNVEGALNAVLKDRELLKKAKNAQAIVDNLVYYPLKPEEAFIIGNENIFPVHLIQNQLEILYLDSQFRNAGEMGTIEIMEGKYKFIADKSLRYLDFPTKREDNTTAGIMVYEHPVPNAPDGLYIAGCDPYSQDAADSSPSLGSCFIYKRFNGLSGERETIVAEYTARPKTTDEFYENVRKLLVYYNARCLYENNVPGLMQYFRQRNCTFLLYRQPKLIKDIVDHSSTSKQYGIRMTATVKQYMLNMIANWLNEEYEEGHTNTEKLLSTSLLKELKSYNDKDNFDRVIAFGLCLLQTNEMFRQKEGSRNIQVDKSFSFNFQPKTRDTRRNPVF